MNTNGLDTEERAVSNWHQEISIWIYSLSSGPALPATEVKAPFLPDEEEVCRKINLQSGKFENGRIFFGALGGKRGHLFCNTLTRKLRRPQSPHANQAIVCHQNKGAIEPIKNSLMTTPDPRLIPPSNT